MPHDPILLADTRSWLLKAALDIKAAQLDLAGFPPLLADAVFHCQQAVEKSFKGFLMWFGIPFRKTHSLEELGEQCLDLDATLKELVDQAVPLTEYAWKFRYPGDIEEPTSQEAEEALQIAREVHAAILYRLPQEIQK